MRKVTIPVAAGRNLAVLVEAAVRNEILKLRGIDSMAEFLARQATQMEKGDDELTQSLVVVSGLSGSGKSIALKVLEDAGYYCVDNLPATLLLEVADFLALEAHHERIAVSVDARSASLPALPENIERLKARGFDCRVIYLEANTPTLLRRFSETRRRHPVSGDMTLSEAIERERALLAGVAPLGQRIDTSELQPRVLQNWIRDLLGLGAGALTLLFESFSYKQGVPLDADWVLDARMIANPHYDPKLRPYTGRDAPVIEYLEHDALAQQWLADVRALLARWLPGDRAREPQPRDGGDRLHRRPPSLGLPRRAPGRDFPRRMEGARAPPRPFASGELRIEDLPLFPLLAVLFPGGRLPLRIFEQRYMDMAKACLKDGSPFGVCLILEGGEVGTPATPAAVGTTAAFRVGTCRSSVCCTYPPAANSASASAAGACSPTASRARPSKF